MEIPRRDGTIRDIDGVGGITITIYIVNVIPTTTTIATTPFTTITTNIASGDLGLGTQQLLLGPGQTLISNGVIQHEDVYGGVVRHFAPPRFEGEYRRHVLHGDRDAGAGGYGTFPR